MDDFAIKSESEKKIFFELTADRKGLQPRIVEKDFWVCWTLKQLYSISNIKNYLIFKGGTSLSKVYGLIERFSEDIDISIDSYILGFIDFNDQFNSITRKQQESLLKQLSKQCGNFVQSDLMAILQKHFRAVLGSATNSWDLELDDLDPTGQTIIFHYPSSNPISLNSYIPQSVKMEFGARGGREPTSIRKITPMIEEAIPNTLKSPYIEVKVLAAERTFWEKATILHQYAHLPEDKTIAHRQSRHYFDFQKLLQSDIRNKAINDSELLKLVVEHKKIYFRSGWANYDAAKKGSLRLIPNEKLLIELEKDFNKMQEMFYGKKSTWEQIIDEISMFENEYNKQDERVFEI
jgi:hypothetical protein